MRWNQCPGHTRPNCFRAAGTSQSPLPKGDILITDDLRPPISSYAAKRYASMHVRRLSIRSCMTEQHMHNSRKLLKIRSFHFNSRAKHRKFSRVSLFLELLVFAGSITACVMGTTSTPAIVSTPIADCFPSSVFTAADMQARVDCHPNDYKLTISKDTVVLFGSQVQLLTGLDQFSLFTYPRCPKLSSKRMEVFSSKITNHLRARRLSREY